MKAYMAFLRKWCVGEPLHRIDLIRVYSNLYSYIIKMMYEIVYGYPAQALDAQEHHF